jgi:uncharacterized membrane protein
MNNTTMNNTTIMEDNDMSIIDETLAIIIISLFVIFILWCLFSKRDKKRKKNEILLRQNRALEMANNRRVYRIENQ